VMLDGHIQCSLDGLQMRFDPVGQHFDADDVIRQVAADRRRHVGVCGIAVAECQKIPFAGVYMADQVSVFFQHRERIFAIDRQRTGVQLHENVRVIDLAHDLRR
nr:hypothetical protein [Tanacetum cinerariifolium]